MAGAQMLGIFDPADTDEEEEADGSLDGAEADYGLFEIDAHFVQYVQSNERLVGRVGVRRQGLFGCN